MTTWGQLVSCALVGTARRPLPPPGAEPWAPLTTRPTAEARALALAAALGTARRAGYVPPGERLTPLAPSPADARPMAPVTACQLLDLLLGGEVRIPGGPQPLVRAWLDEAHAAGRRPADRHLVDLLQLGVHAGEHRVAVAAAVGPRGRWLAAQNPAWSWAVAVGDAVGAAAQGDGTAVPSADAVEALERQYLGTARAARPELLRAARLTAPTLARELARRRFPSEPAADRAILVEACRHGLGDADEPFLEAVLDDRAATVRQAAVALLDRLPGSRRAARMAARLVPLVRLRGRLRPQLEVDWPVAPDDGARRDGVLADGPRGRGRQAWWLQQLVAAAPLRTWEAELGRAPTEIVGLGADRPELVDGWVAAAVAQGDARWAEALFPLRPQPALLGPLTAEVAEAAAARWAGRRPNLVALATVLAHLPRPWGRAFSGLLVERLAALGKEVGHQLSGLAPALAHGLAPAVAPDLERWAAALTDDDALRRQVRAIHHALSLRQTIIDQFRGVPDA